MRLKLVKLALMFSMFFSSWVYAGVAIIVHPSNNASLDEETIAKIFLGKYKKYPDGGQAIPVDLTQGASARTSFVDTVLKKSDSQMKAYWSKLLFTGKGVPPKEVDTDAEVIDLVANNPSIIGYIDSSAVNDSVKVVYQF
ncbi:phosphate ABC transporter substrate-binding protein [Colwellia sp. RE-S-Sl-9]